MFSGALCPTESQADGFAMEIASPKVSRGSATTASFNIGTPEPNDD
jgi:hypothetical protein